MDHHFRQEQKRNGYQEPGMCVEVVEEGHRDAPDGDTLVAVKTRSGSQATRGMPIMRRIRRSSVGPAACRRRQSW